MLFVMWIIWIVSLLSTCIPSLSVDFQHDIPVALLTNEDFSDVISLLRVYQSQHNADAVFNDPNFCSRKFAVAVYACPQAIGNHMHEFLNPYAAALITNRTVLWSFCGRKPCRVDFESDCNEVLNRFSWLPSLDNFHKHWKEKGCNESSDEVLIVRQVERYRADQISMCCGFDEFKFPVVNYGTHEMHEFYGLSVPNARLSPASKQRAKILFRNGEDFAYGMLFRTSFRFQNFIVQNNNRAVMAGNLSQLVLTPSTLDPQALQFGGAHHRGHKREHLVIGVHLRHSGTSGDDAHTIDKQGMACLNLVLGRLHNQSVPSAAHSANRQCTVLLVSDRNQSINYWRESSEMPCNIITTTHTKSHIEWTEHGPFTGEIAMHDIELASRADVFIGSSYHTRGLYDFISTFSMLIAERRASAGHKHSVRFRARWLPNCEEVIGNRFTTRSMYLNPNETCNKPELPPACPFFDPTA